MAINGLRKLLVYKHNLSIFADIHEKLFLFRSSSPCNICEGIESHHVAICLIVTDIEQGLKGALDSAIVASLL